jgi:hypothetical protein
MKKYLFCLIVTTYVVSAIGVPVYLHYCEGELEHVTYLVKGNLCCGESDDNVMQNDCCKDENLIIKNNPNFTFNQNINTGILKSISNLFYTSLLFKEIYFQNDSFLKTIVFESPPPKTQNTLLISTSVLRI